MFPPFSTSENEANAELNLTRSVDRGECPSDVIREIPSRILKNGVSVSAEGERPRVNVDAASIVANDYATAWHQRGNCEEAFYNLSKNPTRPASRK